MICLIPVASSDESHFDGFADSLEHLGPYPDDSALFVVTPSVFFSSPQMMKQIHRIKGLFGNAHEDNIKMTDNDPEGGWPLAPSIHFMHAIKEYSKLMRKDTFYYLESDVTPIRRGWLSELKREYAYAEKPYMGNWEQTVRMVKSNKDQKVYAQFDRHHMVGAGIYPIDYIVRSGPQPPSKVQGEQARFNPNRLWESPNAKEPFDIRCQNYHQPCHNSKLMMHKWHTVNWRQDPDHEGLLFCDDVEKIEAIPLLGDFGLSTKKHEVTYAGPVDLNGVVVVHGCKDGSLARLVCEDAIPGFGPEAVASTDPNRPRSADPDKDIMKKQIEELQNKLEELSKPRKPQGLMGGGRKRMVVEKV